MCVGGGGQVQYFSFLEKITDPLLLINNKKSQGSLRRLSFFKILLVFNEFSDDPDDLTLIKIFQIININLLMYLKF